MTLDGKVALVTGAASGIGLAIAKRFLEADGRVAIADLNLEAAKTASAEVADRKTAIGIGMDVADESQVNWGLKKSFPPLAGWTFWFPTLVSKLCTQSRTFPTPIGSA